MLIIENFEEHKIKIEQMYSHLKDEAIIEDIQANNIEFTEEGEI